VPSVRVVARWRAGDAKGTAAGETVQEGAVSYCMCGAEDCKRCHPSNFRHGEFVGDMDEDELEQFEDGYDEFLTNQAEAREEDERTREGDSE
jgi:hypothetical protein